MRSNERISSYEVTYRTALPYIECVSTYRIATRSLIPHSEFRIIIRANAALYAVLKKENDNIYER